MENENKKSAKNVIRILSDTKQGTEDDRVLFNAGGEILERMQNGQSMKNVVSKSVEDLKKELKFRVNGSQTAYILERELGRGYWGKVFLALDETGREIAIKILEPNEQAKRILKKQNISLVEILKKEAIPLQDSNCSHIVPRRFESARENSAGFIIMPRYEQFLDHYLNEKDNRKHLNNGLDLTEVIRLSRDIATGLSEIHNKLGRAYGDLKPDNIALDAKGTALINDLGTTTIGRTLGRRGLIGYEFTRAPENWNENAKPTKTGDVWAFASLMYRMFTGKYILEDELADSIDPEEYLAKLKKEESEKIIKQKLKLVPIKYQNLLARCLNPNIDQRYQNASEIVTELERLSTEQEANKMVKYNLKERIKLGLVSAGVTVLMMLGLAGAVKLASNPEKDQKIKSQQEMIKFSEEVSELERGVNEYSDAANTSFNNMNETLNELRSNEYEIAIRKYQSIIGRKIFYDGETKGILADSIKQAETLRTTCSNTFYRALMEIDPENKDQQLTYFRKILEKTFEQSDKVKRLSVNSSAQPDSKEIENLARETLDLMELGRRVNLEYTSLSENKKEIINDRIRSYAKN